MAAPLDRRMTAEASTESTPLVLEAGLGSSRKIRHSTTAQVTASARTAFGGRFSPEDDVPDQNAMSPAAFVFNMVCDLAPPGMLPLSYGMAMGSGWWVALCLVPFCMAMAWYSMGLVARAMEKTGEKTFRAVWAKAIGPGTAWVPVLVVFVVCMGNCVVYSVFFGDLLRSFVRGLGVTGWLGSREAMIILPTLFPLLPLCLLKDLAALQYSSFFGAAAVLYTLGVMVLRLLDGSYQEGGKYYQDLNANSKPIIPTGPFEMVQMSSLVLVNTLAVSYMAHYNAPKYYRELVDHTVSSFKTVVAVAMGIACSVYLCSMTVGFLTFGVNSRSVILHNYSPNDPLATAAQGAVGAAIVCSFPLMFCGLREAAIDLAQILAPSLAPFLEDATWINIVSIKLLGVACTLSLLLADSAGLVVGVIGAVCGSAIMYIVPSLMFTYAAKQEDLESKREIFWVQVLTGYGVLIGIGGLITSLEY